MHLRNSFRFTNLAVAFCLLLAFTLLTAGSWHAQAQTQIPAPDRGNQSAAQSGGAMTLANHTPQKVLDGTAFRVSHYNPENKLRLVLAVHDSHMAEEDEFIKELTTKNSPNFHKFITQDEWNARFAPAAEDEQAVVDWAQSVGLTVTQRYPNRLLVDVEGAAGTIEKVFGVTINNYQLGDEVDFSNDRDPVIPASLSSILHSVAGLNNMERVHRIGSRNAKLKGPDYVAGPVIAAGEHLTGLGDPAKAQSNRPHADTSESTPSDSYGLGCIGSTCIMNPDNIWSSEGYNFNALQRFSHCCNVHNDSGGSPAVSSIALVGYGAFNDSDVEEFFDWYGLAYNINVWWVDGSSPAVDGEAPLDVEYSGAMSNNPGTPNNTSHIYEYEMADGSLGTYEDAFAQIVSQDHAKVVSTSYGGTEALSGPWNTAETGALHTTFNNMVATGYTLIAASGDNGASDGCGDAFDVDYPSSDPDFIAAGGTQLLLDGSGLYVSETGWQGEFWTNAQNNGNGGACANNHGGSTGGVSSIFSAPWWQNSSGTTIDLLSPTYLWLGGNASNPVGTEYYYTGNTNRLVPDMALTANPDVMGEWYYSTCCKGGGWQDEGGTSIVAPELAGFFAQENTYLNYIGNICGSDGTTACTPVGLASPFLYENGANNTHHNPFYDMLSGCSDNDITVADDLYYYCAMPGFDLVTGWGSANMMQLAWGINWQLIPAYSVPVITFNDKPAINTWYNTDQEVSWTVTDGLSQGSGTPSGVAGFTQGWDSIPSDPYSEAHSGEGNSFYSGPEYAFGKNGCLSLNGGFGCSGNGGAQGCHTVQIEGWDNQGGTAYGSYGPLCYDTVAPTISFSANPAISGWLDKSVVITLTPTDPGGGNASGISRTYYSINNDTTCAPGAVSGCGVYSGPVTVSAQGQTTFYYFTKDNAGNWSTWWYIVISIDTTKPVTTASLSGTISSGSTYQTAVRVTLNASTTGGSGVANTYYELDGGAQTAYSGIFTVSALGSHSVRYWSVSGSGEVETSHVVSFSIASPTTAALVATPNPAVLGNSVKMTATIKATLSGTPTGTVTFWNGATNLGTSTLSGGVATLSTTALPAGALTLQVSYPATGNFLATNSAPFDETVNENTTTTVTASLNPIVYGQTVTLGAQVTPSSSGIPTGSVSFYSGSTLVGFATLNSSGIASLPTNSLAVGTDSIKGVYSGDSIYLTSTSPLLNEIVNKASQTITFATPPAQTYGTPYTLTATASSGLAVSYVSTTTSVCTVSGSTVTFLVGGADCTIRASQAGNSNYNAAPNVTQTFLVHVEHQTITFGTLPAQTYGAAPFGISATASSGLPVSFASTTNPVCTVSGSTVILVEVGTCTIKATQAGNNQYAVAAAVSQSFAVNKASQTITFTPPPTQTYGTPYTLSATASSGLAVSYVSTTASVCTVSGSTVTFVSGGADCTIQASQAGDTDYNAAPKVTQSFLVHVEHQTITFVGPPSTPLSAGSVSLSATASSGLAVTFTSTTTGVCTVSGTTATLVSAGACTIKASQAGNDQYAVAASVTQSFTVTAN